MLLRQGPISNDPPDRRAMRRFSMKLPASVRVPGIPSPFATETVNVSARGIFFYLDRWMKEGSQVEVTMNFPSQVTLTDPLRVRFLAKVVRVEPQDGNRMGVAATIEEYEFLRSEEDSSAGLRPGWSYGTSA
jgi:PilZ domain